MLCKYQYSMSIVRWVEYICLNGFRTLTEGIRDARCSRAGITPVRYQCNAPGIPGCNGWLVVVLTLAVVPVPFPTFS